MPFARAVSVGGGAGFKEMQLIEQGLIEHFDLFELSKGRIELGRERAHEKGLETKITFHYGDAFELVAKQNYYDLVYWNNSLHHMMNAEKAVVWSRNVLKKGGLFVMDDYVGPSRTQWSDKALSLVNFVRLSLPEKCFVSPYNVEKKIKRKLGRPNVIKMLLIDPSECADSENILGSIYR